jgi:hypothetical protein
MSSDGEFVSALVGVTRTAELPPCWMVIGGCRRLQSAGPLFLPVSGRPAGRVRRDQTAKAVGCEQFNCRMSRAVGRLRDPQLDAEVPSAHAP